LRPHLVRIDGDAAIDGADDAVDFRPAGLVDRNLGDLRDIGAEGLGDRNASEAAGGRWEFQPARSWRADELWNQHHGCVSPAW